MSLRAEGASGNPDRARTESSQPASPTPETVGIQNGSPSQPANSAPETVGIQNGPGLFEREDWKLFRSLTTLPQKAGVSLYRLPSLVAKELADNALDAGGTCEVGLLGGGANGFYVADDGPGIPGDDAAVARLFSIGRPLASSKLVRLPTRGMLGNGLRVVAGVVLASRGSLTVATRGRELRLTPRDDGGTGAEVIGPAPAQGTRVEVRFGPDLAVGAHALSYAELAIDLAAVAGPAYRGRTSPHWYDDDAFWELCEAAGGRSVRELLAGSFDGCAEPAAGKVAGVVVRGRLARDLTRAEAAAVLRAARARAKPVNSKRLGCVGRDAFDSGGYARQAGERKVRAGVTVPYVVEAWAKAVGDDRGVYYDVYVNRTPVVCDDRAWVEWKDGDRTLVLYGCNAFSRIKIGRRPVGVSVNVDTPFMPITTDGKTPDLFPLGDVIAEVASKAARQVARNTPREPVEPRGTEPGPGPKRTQKDLIIAAIPGAIAVMSGPQGLRFNQRNLFYGVRDTLKRQLPPGPDGQPVELQYPTFCGVITDYEAETGPIPKMYRDPRGSLYHPHTGEEIPLGTIAVEKYVPPRWTFNKVIYCEKEGFTEIMKETGWPERNDCALISSKGFASRAARDLFDLLGGTDQEIEFFCVHDADAYGTMIYQTLQEATRARGARKVKVINLGLEPDEALALGLDPEPVALGRKRKAVARYVDREWADWLQSHRVELNAMSTPAFIAWLDAKLADHAGKVVPPDGVLADRLRARVRANLDATITRRVLAEAAVPARVEAALAARAGAIEDATPGLAAAVAQSLAEDPDQLWKDALEPIAEGIAGGGGEVASA
jgi:hypothetical protein